MPEWAFYHDCDEMKCEIVREAIKARAITDGEVVCGDIEKLQPGQLVGFSRVHLFAGGAFWDLALNLAGWPNGREVWTLSCPCPSFSAAGKGQGFDDPRHLWPEAARLIRERRPGTLIGEQVAAAIGHGWLDVVCGDLEAQGYAVAAAVLGAHSVGAPHIRQRLYFVAALADAADPRRQTAGQYRSGLPLLPTRPEQCGDIGLVADSAYHGCGEERAVGGRIDAGDRPQGMRPRPQSGGDALRMGHASGTGPPDRQPEELCGQGRGEEGRAVAEPSEASGGLADADGGISGDRGIQRGGEHRQQQEDGGAGELAGGSAGRWQSYSEWFEVCWRPNEGDCDTGCACGRRTDAPGGWVWDADEGWIDAGGVAEPLHPERGPLDEHGADGRDRQDNGRQEARSLFGARGEIRGPGAPADGSLPVGWGAGALNGFWAGADWIGCRDGKFRPVPGTTESGPLGVAPGCAADLGYFLLPGGGGYAFSPLIEKGKARPGRLRLYGDAICVPAARAFIESYLETERLEG